MKDRLINLAKNILPYGYVSKKQDWVFHNIIKSPTVYNKDGQEMLNIYLQDNNCRIQPYGFVAGRFPKNIHWDRFNKAMEIQMYTHREILKLSPYTPKKRFAYFIESEALTPKTYQILDKNKELASEFNAIFTTSDKHLETFSNAKFLPAGGVWYGQEFYGGVIHEDLYKQKTKNISIVSSIKTQCELHKFRLELARHLKKQKNVDAFGTFDGGRSIKIGDSLEKYRYSIVIENNIADYYFTEKILNCFASMTIPIYIGARKIDKFFNKDGIIQINDIRDLNDIEKLLENLGEDYYNERVLAIKENYEKVKEFMVIEDYLYNHYVDVLKI